jgi:hypothetical protein
MTSKVDAYILEYSGNRRIAASLPANATWERPMPDRNSELRGAAAIGHLSDAPWLNASYSRVVEKLWQSAEPSTASPGWRATIEPCYQVVLEVESRTADKTDDHPFGGSTITC